MSDGPTLQSDSVRAAPTEPQLWKALYEKTRRKSEPEKLLTLVHATEAALYHRWEEGAESPIPTEEVVAMDLAAQDLLAIKIHKLAWPDPCY